MTAELDAARAALDHGDAKRALRQAWKAALAAVAARDPDGLDAAIEVAAAIRDRSQGRAREDASQLVDYATYARDHPQPLRIGGAGLRSRESGG